MKLYGGWIDAKPSQKGYLRFLGVKGEMIYNDEKKCFEYCDCNIIDIIILSIFFKGFWAGCFTAYDPKTGKNLPAEQQLNWD